MYERLYFIGNGFDLHHGIKSGYLDYREWLEKNNRSLLEDIDKLYDFCDDDWWSDFEHSLGNIDVAKIANEIYAERRPDFGSEGFRDRDYYEARIEAELIFDKLYKNIRESFKEWIKSLDKGQEDKKVYLNINNAAFINFNYTNTLQDLYGISDNDVYSIHGNVAKGTNLVLGHGKTEDQISPKKPVMPEGLSDEECEKWLDDNATDYSYDITENEVVSQVLKQKKDVAKIIAGNERLWKKLKNVIEMNLYGISFSDIDTPYIDHVAFITKDNNVWWNAVIYNDADDRNLKNTFDFFQSRNIYNYNIQFWEDLKK